MITISNLTFSRGGSRIFSDVSVALPAAQKIGVVGANGVGKTTLFGLIDKTHEPESGTITFPPKYRIGGVKQEVPAGKTSLIDTVLQADTERTSLLLRAETEQNPDEIAAIQARLVDINAWSAEARAASILTGLGFSSKDHGAPCEDFSGGWRMRVALGALLFSQPDILLLDEPTNHLDLEGAAWLQSYLARYPYTTLLISHDRALLNSSVGYILNVTPDGLSLWKGGYDDFAAARAARDLQNAAQNEKIERKRAHLESFVDRFRAKASKAKQAQSRLKQIEKLGSPASLSRPKSFDFTFPQPDVLAPPLVKLEHVAAGYVENKVLVDINLNIPPQGRIALLGQNGQGKSTLAKTLAKALTPLSGDVSHPSKMRIGYFAQHQLDALDAEETPLETLRRYNKDLSTAQLRAKLAGVSLGSQQAELKIKHLSGGQKARLALSVATQAAPHLLILDEPTNHLDIESREALADALLDYKGAVVIVSHDIHLLNLVVDTLWLVKDGRVKKFDGSLDDYSTVLLSEKDGSRSPKAKPKASGSRATPQQKPASVSSLKRALDAAEARVEKIMIMSDKLSQKLADPALYEDSKRSELQKWQAKYTEVTEALERAEALWMEAQMALETATS